LPANSGGSGYCSVDPDDDSRASALLQVLRWSAVVRLCVVTKPVLRIAAMPDRARSLWE
jgi:hypothetical protein